MKAWLHFHLWTYSLEELLQGYPTFETFHPLDIRSVQGSHDDEERASLLLAKISEETPANLLDSEFKSSSTAAVTSARASSEGYSRE
jgi:hypothetical protein